MTKSSNHFVIGTFFLCQNLLRGNAVEILNSISFSFDAQNQLD